MGAAENNYTFVTILGSGTCVPSLARSSCSVFLNVGGVNLLFDSGAGTIQRLLQAGVGIFDLSYLFLSHFHPDHSGEVASLLFSMKYPEQRKTPFCLVGGRGLVQFYSALKGAHGEWIDPGPDILKLIEMDNLAFDRIVFDNFTVTSAPVSHNAESIAYKVSDMNGKSFVYSGDTDFSENLISLAKDVDLLICESAFPDDLKVPGHLTPSLAGEIATRANVKKLVLTHFYPECEDADMEGECRKTYAGPLVLAKDLMKIEL